MFMFETHLLLSVGDFIFGWREMFGDSVINKLGALLDKEFLYLLAHIGFIARKTSLMSQCKIVLKMIRNLF